MQALLSFDPLHFTPIVAGRYGRLHYPHNLAAWRDQDLYLYYPRCLHHTVPIHSFSLTTFTFFHLPLSLHISTQRGPLNMTGPLIDYKSSVDFKYSLYPQHPPILSGRYGMVRYLTNTLHHLSLSPHFISFHSFPPRGLLNMT